MAQGRFPMKTLRSAACLVGMLMLCAMPIPAGTVDPAPAYDAALAKRLGADERGMRRYVLVILKSGTKPPVPEGEPRKTMFAGHFANIQRLADGGKLVLAGPFDDEGGWRGLFLLAVDTIEEAKQLTATDPVIASGEMVAEYHAWYGSAAAMRLPEIHKTLTPPKAETGKTNAQK
jgi:uncharacterized protein YciI